jgi:hypothetical protein
MKSLKEKKMLARLARNAGTPDLALEESIRREEELDSKLFVTKPQIIKEDKIFVQELVDDPNSSSGKSLVLQAAEAIHAPPSQPPVLQEKLRDAEIAGIRKQISDLIARMGTLSWGGGGTGVVRFENLDDHQHPTDIRILEFNTAGAGTDLVPAGSLSWNPVEECLNVHQPDGTVLQAGLEQYIRVYNNTGDTLTQGMFVMFSGVHEPASEDQEHAPTVVGFTAGGGYPPLYTVGVLTEDILDGDYGRATTFGKVRNIDTTGTAVGETWANGDLLWAHPTIPGALTNVQPSAPYVVVSVAAVLHAGANGELLVRPAIFPRLHYGTFSSNTEQTAAQTNTPYAVTFDTTGTGCGHIQINPNNTANVNVVHQGLYSFDFRLQVTSTNSSRSFIWIWARVNGVDVPRSASKISIESNGGEVTPSWAFRLPMNSGDVFQLMWAVDSTNVKLSAPAATAFAPATPSALLQVTQVNL